MSELLPRERRARAVRDTALTVLAVCLALLVLFAVLKEAAQPHPEATVEPSALVKGTIDDATPYVVALSIVSSITMIAAHIVLWINRR